MKEKKTGEEEKHAERHITQGRNKHTKRRNLLMIILFAKGRKEQTHTKRRNLLMIILFAEGMRNQKRN